MEPVQIGAILSCKYRIDRLCQEIGGVLLYEATDTEHARVVCVKVIRREALANPDAFARFQSGAHDPSVIDFGIVGGLPFYVTTQRDDVPIELDEDDYEEEDITLEHQTREAS